MVVKGAEKMLLGSWSSYQVKIQEGLSTYTSF